MSLWHYVSRTWAENGKSHPVSPDCFHIRGRSGRSSCCTVIPQDPEVPWTRMTEMAEIGGRDRENAGDILPFPFWRFSRSLRNFPILGSLGILSPAPTTSFASLHRIPVHEWRNYRLPICGWRSTIFPGIPELRRPGMYMTAGSHEDFRAGLIR